MPYNALRHLEKNQNRGLSYYGGYSMQGDTIKISSRTLVEILSGDLDINKFIEDHFCDSSDTILSAQLPESSNDHQMYNFFKNKILEGKMIEKIDIDKSNDEDDDWVVIKFGRPDPAISPYR